jgi:hypothetical protein
VVKCQAIDNTEVIFSRIWPRNIVRTSYWDRKGRCEPLSPSEAYRSTTKSSGIWIQQYLAHYHTERNHQGLNNHLITQKEGVSSQTGPVVRRERLGGLLRYYHHEAA